MRPTLLLPALVAHFLLLTLPPSGASANSLNRDSDPVVITGADLGDLLGKTPASVVAFRYESGWTQIPVQIDERVVIDYGLVYNSAPIGFSNLVYADAGAFTGADSDAAFDADDELVFMAKDAGDRALGQPYPAGVVVGSRIEVKVTDPITLQEAWVYLFESLGGLVPDAGANYVTYTFGLLSGPYLTTYNTTMGPNAENSEIVTPEYRMHFSDRWIRDEINVYAGGATGVDVLDRHKNLFAPGNCARSEDTFSNGEGAFFTNKDGPVRAIRSYMGANSGPLTQRDHLFYERRHDVRTTLRVHPITGILDFYDYSPAASGMTYTNDLNLGGVPIDGSPEVIAQGAIVWEMVTGLQGTLIYAGAITTDVPGFSYTSYWLDDTSPSTMQCTGDPDAYGSSGVWITNIIPNTDPVFFPPPFFNMVFDRTSYIEPPNQSVALAQARYQQATQPLTVDATVATGIVSGAPPLAKLTQNFPNPFTHSTSISVTVPAGERAAIRVYDVAGRRVATLAANVTGSVSVRWDARDAEGRRVPSGLYFYHLETRSGTFTRKMVVLK